MHVNLKVGSGHEDDRLERSKTQDVARGARVRVRVRCARRALHVVGACAHGDGRAVRAAECAACSDRSECVAAGILRMSAPLLLLHGTWGRNDEWYKRGSDFVRAAYAHDLDLVSDKPFLWSGKVGGLPTFTPDDPDDVLDDAGRLEWANEAQHAVYYCAAYRPGQEVSIIAHSHGGAVALLAIAYGKLKVRHLITVSTPVRRDMCVARMLVQQRISGTWLALHGDFWKDWMIKAGELFDGHFGWSMNFPEAHANRHVIGHGHSTMLADPRVFASLGVWDLLLK